MQARILRFRRRRRGWNPRCGCRRVLTIQSSVAPSTIFRDPDVARDCESSDIISSRVAAGGSIKSAANCELRLGKVVGINVCEAKRKRSEERRVGKECRCRRAHDDEKERE